jgi:hypothetical protein
MPTLTNGGLILLLLILGVATVALLLAADERHIDRLLWQAMTHTDDDPEEGHR